MGSFPAWAETRHPDSSGIAGLDDTREGGWSRARYGAAGRASELQFAEVLILAWFKILRRQRPLLARAKAPTQEAAVQFG